jgi:RND family efflux transporter MFP subunit
MDSESPAARGRRGRWTWSAGAVAVLVLVGVAAARMVPVEQRTAAAPGLLPVAVLELRPSGHYRVNRPFIGRIEASRQGALGFELDGLLAAVAVDEGDRVRAGDLLAELDTARLQARRRELRAALAEAQANQSLAEITVDRLRGVVDSGGVSRQGLDEAREALRAAQAARRLAEARIATVDIEIAKARLVAPFDGIITRRHFDEGRVLSAGAPVLELQETATPEARIGVGGSLVEALEVGERHRLTVAGRDWTGEVRAVLPLRTGGTRTVDVLLRVDAPVGVLRAGDLVRLELDERREQRGYWVPLEALAEGRRGLWSLYALEPATGPGEATHRVVPRTVEVLHQTGELAYVQGALRAQVRVVADGLHRVVPGQLVQLAGDAKRLALGDRRHDD